jgi:hypothetical protein
MDNSAMPLMFDRDPAKRDARPAAPDVLVHLHIAKTGGTSLSSLVKHGFRQNEIFEWTRHGVDQHSGLDVATLDSCRQQLTRFGLDRVRYISGHMPFGVHSLLDRPSKYMTVLRHPVERIVSLFYFLRQLNVPFRKDGKPLSFEDYVESRSDIQLLNCQVRVVSGCADLDAAPPPAPGEIVPAAAVERRHLDQAKRNIEERFLTIGTIEQMTDLALLVRRIYGWPMSRLQTEYKNATRERPRGNAIAPRLLKIIEDCNSYDMELYEWAGKRFAAQRMLFEPGLSRDRLVYGVVNRGLNVAGAVLPWQMRKRIAQFLFYAR